MVINSVPGSSKCWMVRRSCRHVPAMWDKSFVVLMESCWAIRNCVLDSVATLIVSPYDCEAWNVHLLPTVLQSCPVSIVIWSGCIVDFICTVFLCTYSCIPLCVCVYLFVLTLSAGLCVFVAHQCDLCELSDRAAETIARWEWRGETLRETKTECERRTDFVLDIIIRK